MFERPWTKSLLAIVNNDNVSKAKAVEFIMYIDKYVCFPTEMKKRHPDSFV